MKASGIGGKGGKKEGSLALPPRGFPPRNPALLACSGTIPSPQLIEQNDSDDQQSHDNPLRKVLHIVQVQNVAQDTHNESTEQ